MRILIEGRSNKHYIAKCHEAFRTGLRAMFDTRCFGKGYRAYRPFVRTYAQIIRQMFPDALPDIVIANCDYPYNPRGFRYDGIAEVTARKAVILADYWEVSEHDQNGYARFIVENSVDIILSYFPQPLGIWATSAIAERFVYMPPCFDPAIFNDWQMPKRYDVGFLAAGTTEPSPFYPERSKIHKVLLESTKLRYLWKPHPGWGYFRDSHPLIGRGFSKAINSCLMFITTGGTYLNAHAKYVEILASKTLLLADEPIGFERLRLEDGVNYVKISEDDFMDKIDFYVSRPDLCAKIAQNGYATAMRYHTCYARALDYYEAIVAKTSQGRYDCRPLAHSKSDAVTRKLEVDE